MSDVIPISAESLRWLQRLARGHEQGEEWDDGETATDHAELTAIGMVEHRAEAWRLTDIGWWAMGRAVLKGEDPA